MPQIPDVFLNLLGQVEVALVDPLLVQVVDVEEHLVRGLEISLKGLVSLEIIPCLEYVDHRDDIRAELGPPVVLHRLHFLRPSVAGRAHFDGQSVVG